MDINATVVDEKLTTRKVNVGFVLMRNRSANSSNETFRGSPFQNSQVSEHNRWRLRNGKDPIFQLKRMGESYQNDPRLTVAISDCVESTRIANCIFNECRESEWRAVILVDRKFGCMFLSRIRQSVINVMGGFVAIVGISFGLGCPVLFPLGIPITSNQTGGLKRIEKVYAVEMESVQFR
jgi:hypothetical protein